ncbi:MAG TPA: hypothetical protein PK006_05925 [Saprospiraceae bacterium]|nr:hypothetical protein [Saprospiraceae bacterium]
MKIRLAPTNLCVQFLNSTSTGQISSLENLEELNKTNLKKTIKSFFKDFTSFGKSFELNGGVSLNLRSHDISGALLSQDPFFSIEQT